MIDNEDRAEWGRTALAAFKAEAFKHPNVEDDITALGDLVCDLLHTARREGVKDMREWLDRRLACFEEEEQEEAMDIEAEYTP